MTTGAADDSVKSEEMKEEARKLRYAIGFAFLFMCCELVGGYIANSVAIMTDAAHLLADVGGLFVSLMAVSWTTRIATEEYTYGFHQAEIIGAFLSISMVWLLTGGLIVEAWARIQNPAKIDGEIMFGLATLGVVVNLIMFKLLGHNHGHGGHGHRGAHSHGSHGHGHGQSPATVVELADRVYPPASPSLALEHNDHSDHERSDSEEVQESSSLAMRAAIIHVIGDLVQSIGVMIAGLCIWIHPFDIGYTDETKQISNWNYMDPLCTFLFAMLVLLTTKSTAMGILDSVMMRTPKHLKAGRIKRALEKEIKIVSCVHDLHIWSVGQMPCLTCHAVVEKAEDCGPALRDMTDLLSEKFQIEHVTIQLEIEGEFDHTVESYGGIHGRTEFHSNKCCHRSNTPPFGFLQQTAKLHQETAFHLPLRDPFDTSPAQLFEKWLWFLILLLPILTAVLVSVFVIGCPACCRCCCFDGSRPQSEGEGEEQHQDGGQDVEAQVADLEKLFAEDAGGRDSALATPKSMLEQVERDSEHRGNSTQTNTTERASYSSEGLLKVFRSLCCCNVNADGEGECRCRKIPRRGGDRCCWMNGALWTLAVLIAALIELLCVFYAVYDQHWDHNPRTKVVIISSGGGSGHMVASRNLRNAMTHKTTVRDQTKCADPLGNDCCAHSDWNEPQLCRDGYVAIPDPSPSTSCSSLLATCALYRAGVGCYGCYAPANRTSDSRAGMGCYGCYAPGANSTIEADDGARGVHVTKQEERNPVPLLMQPEGWAPYDGAAPIRLEKDQVEVIYSIPPECKTDPKTKETILTAECQRRSWLNLPLISLGILELLLGRVIADVGEHGRDDWNAAQKQGDLKKQRRLIDLKHLTETIFGHNAYAAVTQYLERHPNVELAWEMGKKWDVTQHRADLEFYKKKLGLQDSVLDRTRWTDGILRPPFMAAWRRMLHMIKTLQDPSALKTAAIVLRNVPQVNGGSRPVEIAIRKHEEVFSIMLGSQVTVEAALWVLRRAAQRSSRSDSKTGDWTVLTDLCVTRTIFVFCGGNKQLASAVTREAERIKKMPGPGPAKDRKALRVYALGWQDADTIARIYERATSIVIRGGGVFEKWLWFLILLLPILTAVLVSVFVIGCPACCRCCCFDDLQTRALDKHKDRAEKDQGPRHPQLRRNIKNRGRSRSMNSGGDSRPQLEAGEGEEQQQADGGEVVVDVAAQVADLDKLVAEEDSGGRDSALTAPKSMLEQMERDSEHRGNYRMYDQHWDHNPRTKVVIISSGGGSGHMVAAMKLFNDMTNKTAVFDRPREGSKGLTPKFREVGVDSLRTGPVTKCADVGNDCCAHSSWGEPQQCREGYLAIPDPSPSTLCHSLFPGCAEIRGPHHSRAGMGCYGCYAPANITISTIEANGVGGGARGTQVMKQEGGEIVHVLTQPDGWAPYEGVAPIRLEPDEVEVIYSIPPECKTDPKTKETILTAECQRRSWLNLPLISAGILELLLGRVIADVGDHGRDAWNAAQKKGDLKQLRKFIEQKSLAETFFGHNAYAAVTQYLERHPNVELVVSTQPLNTLFIYNAVVAMNERKAKIATKLQRDGQSVEGRPIGKDIQFVLQMTDPPSKFNFFMPGILQWQAETEPSKRKYYHLDAPIGGMIQAGKLRLETYDAYQHAANLNYYKKTFGLQDFVLDTTRFTGGVLRPPFVAVWLRMWEMLAYKVLGYNPYTVRTKAVVLHNVPEVNGATRPVEIPIRKDEEVATVMLGSQVSEEATLGYVRILAQRASRIDKKTGLVITDLCSTRTIFVFCGGNKKLVSAVRREAKRIKKMPGPGPAKFRNALRVYALGWQDAETIARIYERASTIIIRGGGISAFEAKAAGATGSFLVHSDRPLVKAPGSSRVCTAGMLPHEMGNAAWLAETVIDWSRATSRSRPESGTYEKVWLGDGNLFESFVPNNKTGALLLENDPTTDSTCLSDVNPKQLMP
eukprot:g8378.t1